MPCYAPASRAAHGGHATPAMYPRTISTIERPSTRRVLLVLAVVLSSGRPDASRAQVQGKVAPHAARPEEHHFPGSDYDPEADHMESTARDLRAKANDLNEQADALEGSGAPHEIDEVEGLRERIETLMERARELDYTAEEHRAARQRASVLGTRPAGQP